MCRISEEIFNEGKELGLEQVREAEERQNE